MRQRSQSLWWTVLPLLAPEAGGETPLLAAASRISSAGSVLIRTIGWHFVGLFRSLDEAVTLGRWQPHAGDRIGREP